MSFGNVLGQETALAILKGILADRRLPPALLFAGPDGVGKTMAAVEFAKALNCEVTPGAQDPCDRCGSCLAADKGIDLDLKRVNAAYQALLAEEEPERQQHIKIETIRHLIRDLEMRSFAGRWKTAILEDAHRMPAPAANAMLKSLEEPPQKTIWILTASRPRELLPTILSRVRTVPFKPLPDSLVSAILLRLTASETGGRRSDLRGGPPDKDKDEDESVRTNQVTQAVRIASGSPGRALELLRRRIPDPADWVSDSLAPFRLADGLPRQLHLCRPLVEAHLFRMAHHLKFSAGPDGLGRPPIQRAFREIESLKAALKANADPRLVLELAASQAREAPPQAQKTQEDAG